MSKNIVTPKRVSFEDALRNLASRLTGVPASDLPRSQEGVVQFLAENIPSLDEMAETVTQEVMTRIKLDDLAEAATQEIMAKMAATIPAGEPGQTEAPAEEDKPEKTDSGQQEAHNGLEISGDTPAPREGGEADMETPVTSDKPKCGSGSKAKTAK